MTNEVRHRHFGVVHIPVNYTLGRGVPEALGNRVQAAATTAFLTLEGAGNSHDVAHCEINVDDVGIEVEARWDAAARCVGVHLELIRTEWMIAIEIWSGVAEETEFPRREFQRREIH